MQITFLTLYHDFNDHERSLQDAQDSLLYMWQRSIQLKNVKFIRAAKVEFKDYNFFEYPDQVRARREIQNSYGHKLKKKDGGGYEYYWCGTQYPDLETIYKALSEQKRFMELTITVEDDDD
jgi:hypothetical protein